MDLVPPKLIGERLAKIEAEHPQQYEAGLAAFLGQRAIISYGSTGYLPPNPFGSAHNPFNRTPAPKAVLNIPGVSPSPSPNP
jgi:hypothetical protein